MKKIIILAIFAFTLVSSPLTAKADFDPARLIDPFCLFACDDNPDIVNYTNSNNVNSNINSPNSNIVNGVPTAQTPVYFYDYNYDYSYNRESSLGASCYPTSTYGEVGENIVWRASPYGGNGNYHISWSGTNGLSGNGTSVSKRYSSDGTKNASIVVTSGSQTISMNCGSIDIHDDRNYNYDRYNYNYDRHDYDRYYDDYYNDRNLTVTCSVNTSFAPAGTRVTWRAYASGGSSSYRYEWYGTDNLRGSGRDLETVYNSPGTKTASVTVRSGSRKVTEYCSNSVLVGVPTPVYTNPYPVTPVYTAPVVKVVKSPEVTPEKKVEKDSSLTSLFSLENVPWGWVAILVILVLLFTIVYLVFNKNKI